MNFIVAFMANVLHVAPVQCDIRIRDVVRRQFFFVVHDIAEAFPAYLAHAPVDGDAVSNKSLTAFLPCLAAVKFSGKIFHEINGTGCMFMYVQKTKRRMSNGNNEIPHYLWIYIAAM